MNKNNNKFFSTWFDSAMYIRCDNIADGSGDSSLMLADVPELLCEVLIGDAMAMLCWALEML